VYNLSVNEIASVNNIEQNKIVSGQKLRIKLENYERYAVKKGDTLTAIANKYKTTAESIKKMNKLDADFLKVGQVLIIRQK
jgi:LysM repeat protein